MFNSAISENSGVFGDGSSSPGSAPNSNLILAVASVSDSALPSTFAKKLDRMVAGCSLQFWQLVLFSSSSWSDWQVWLLNCKLWVSAFCYFRISFSKSLTTSSSWLSSPVLWVKFESVFITEASTSFSVWSRQTGRSPAPDLSLAGCSTGSTRSSSLFLIGSWFWFSVYAC